MKKSVLIALFYLLAPLTAEGGLKPGDPAPSFSLRNVDGSIVSLSDYSDQKGVIVVFTSNLCPFSKAYEQRIIKYHHDYSSVGFPVVAINSNSPEISPDDSFDNMKLHYEEKGYPFPYLKDETGEVCKAYGASRNPQVFLLEKSSSGFKIAYMGAIDDNSLDAESVSYHYLNDAIVALIQGLIPKRAVTKPIGCTMKIKAD